MLAENEFSVKFRYLVCIVISVEVYVCPFVVRRASGISGIHYYGFVRFERHHYFRSRIRAVSGKVYTFVSVNELERLINRVSLGKSGYCALGERHLFSRIGKSLVVAGDRDVRVAELFREIYEIGIDRVERTAGLV